MKYNNLFFGPAKIALLTLLFLSGVIISHSGNAKSRIQLNLCFVPPPNSIKTEGTGSAKIKASGHVFDFKYSGSNNPVCNSIMNLTVENNKEDDKERGLGEYEYDTVTVISPLVTIEGGKTGNCSIIIPVKMVVGSISSDGYQVFKPAAGNEGDKPGRGLVKINMGWPLGYDKPTCIADLSGL